METQYNKIKLNSIYGEILINIRKEHVDRISEKLVNLNIIPIQYIDEKIQLDNIRNKTNILINNQSRIDFIKNILNKECAKSLSKEINNLCVSL